MVARQGVAHLGLRKFMEVLKDFQQSLIRVLANAFLLVSYYTIISKYYGNRESSSQSGDHKANVELEEDHNPSLHEPWHDLTIGLDEALIKSITICKYKKGDGLVEVIDCPTCLNEFHGFKMMKVLNTVEEGVTHGGAVQKTTLHALSDLGSSKCRDE
ncbi:E3 ubiquitin-protein [Spatholobus suberectus]|nr:E3 ubiquitin-protein [Spatholobus suberectus]